MKIRSIRREIQILRVYALLSTIAAGTFLLGAVYEARHVSFDTITTHRINVLDREGKLAMTITNHDDFPPPIVNGKRVKRSSGNDENGIVFYNQLGNEQGALIWDGSIAKDGSYSSAVVLSSDSVKTDQLLQVGDSNVNGRESAFLIGWNQPKMTPALQAALDAFTAAKTDAERRTIRREYPELNAPTRFFFGYDADNVSRVTLHDGKGKARIKMFVTAGGQAKLQFLDKYGKITYQIPQE